MNYVNMLLVVTFSFTKMLSLGKLSKRYMGSPCTISCNCM